MYRLMSRRRCQSITRAGFYEGTGAYRDMVVTHLFHILGFVAMKPPTTLDARSIAEETGKVFRSVKPIEPDCVIRGQYAGYRDGAGVAPDSRTETFIAMRAKGIARVWTARLA